MYLVDTVKELCIYMVVANNKVTEGPRDKSTSNTVLDLLKECILVDNRGVDMTSFHITPLNFFLRAGNPSAELHDLAVDWFGP